MATTFSSIPGFFRTLLQRAGLDPTPWLRLANYTGTFPAGIGAPLTGTTATPWTDGTLSDSVGQTVLATDGECWIQTVADNTQQSSWQPKTVNDASEVTDDSVEGAGARTVAAAIDAHDGRLDTLEAAVVPYDLVIAATDETTNLSPGAAKITFRMPRGMTLDSDGVRASVNTAPGATGLEVDILESGVSILSTNITIDSGEESSETAATPPVISDVNLADDAEMTVDIISVDGTTPGKGLKIVLRGVAA